MLDGLLTAQCKTFETNVRLVHDLMEFDRSILHFAIAHLEARQKHLEKAGTSNQYTTLLPAINQLKNIRDNDSLRGKYQAVVNQGLVLLVSYFASTVSELFSKTVAFVAKEIKPERLMKERVELTIEDLQLDEFDLQANLGGLIIEKNDISFQDMKSIARSFNDYLEYDPPRNREVNNIIVAQGCRHAIVHKGSTADQHLVRQLRNAVPRDVKPEIQAGDNVVFSAKEIEVVAKSMTEYLQTMRQALVKKWKR